MIPAQENKARLDKAQIIASIWIRAGLEGFRNAHAAVRLSSAADTLRTHLFVLLTPRAILAIGQRPTTSNGASTNNPLRNEHVEKSTPR